MHREPGVAEQIHRPIPAIRRLEHHLRSGPAFAILLDNTHRSFLIRILSSRRLLRPSADHRPATMQINTDVTSSFQGPPFLNRGTLVEKPECERLGPHGERRPRS